MEHMDLLFYHGPITRERCEEILSAKGKDGSFLIRESETIYGALCLCVFKKKVVYTYRILQTHSGYYTLQSEESNAVTFEEIFRRPQDVVLKTCACLFAASRKTKDDKLGFFNVTRENKGKLSSAGVQEKHFKTLEDLVHHYKKRNQGLVSRLRYSVKRKQTDQESVISNDEPDYENVDVGDDYVEVLPDD